MEVQRIKLSSEEPDWQESFVTWLEKQEKNEVGAEDGVFVAQLDSELILKPEGEEDFLKSCAKNHLDQVDTQRLTKFNDRRIYHFSVEYILKSSATDKAAFNSFKKKCSSKRNFKEDSCCVQILKEEGLEKVLKHLEDCAHRLAMRNTLNDQIFSQVVAEDMGKKMKAYYEKNCNNLDVFKWDKGKTQPPLSCPDKECVHVGDEEQNDVVDNALLVKRSRVQSEDEVNYGYGTSANKTPLMITSKFCLSRIFNLIWLVPDLMPGLHYSYVYFGTAHSCFSIHVEDALLWSLNYLHIGHPKLWIIIPPWATALLDYHLARSGIFLTHTKCRNLLGHKCILPSIQWLKTHRIPFKIVVQNPGDMVVLYPSAAHFGFNLGHNIAEAINIATESWIPWGINSTKCTCFVHNIHLKVTPFVAAFRPDLLPSVLSGRPVMTPQMVRGMKLLSDELSQFKCKESDSSHAKTIPSSVKMGEMLVCPVLKCAVSFDRMNNGLDALVKHVKQNHAPLKTTLLKKIEEMFGSGASK